MNDMRWITALVEELDHCREITIVDMQNKTVFELFTGLVAEVGELAQDICTEQGSFGNSHRETEEGSQVEAVDVIISGLAMYFAQGGTFDGLPEVMKKKLDKWEKNQCASG
jgi:hypothetical protein